MNISLGVKFLITACLFVNNTYAFVHPTSRTFVPTIRSTQQLHQHNMMLPSFTLSDEFVQEATKAFATTAEDPSILSQIGGTLRTVAVAATALIFLVAGVALVTANVLVPKAAEQLEEETRALRPDLWEEYQRKLGPGETLVSRPDLLQELGNLMQPIILANAEQKARQEAGVPYNPPPPPPPPPVSQPTGNSEVDALKKQFESNSMGAFDAEIVEEKKNDNP